MKRSGQERGVALIMVFGVSIIAVLLAALIAQLVAQYYQLQRQQMQRTLHHYLASTGINHAVMELFRRADWLPIPAAEKRTTWVPAVGLTYTISVDHDGDAGTPAIPVEVKISHVGAGPDQYEIKVTAPKP